MDKELEEINDLLIRLNINPDFKKWRDLVAKPEKDKINDAKRNVVGLPEADVKALILYELYIEDLFYKSFERAKVQKELERKEDESA